MRLTTLYVRFYKSFNFDYERKFNPHSRPSDWEQIDGAWFPHVRIDLEPTITTVVGANESGKSHLLDAIEKLIRGQDISAGDFCRYSHLFSVQQGERRSPDFGGEFEVCTQSDVDLAKRHLKLDVHVGNRVRLLRENGAAPRVHVQGGHSAEPTEVNNEQLDSVLPSVFRIDARVPLPASIPLYELASTARRPCGSRRSRGELLKQVFETDWQNENQFKQAAPSFYSLLASGNQDIDTDQLEKQYDLGRSLLFDVAKIDRTTFEDLAAAIAAGKEGYANGLFQRINDSLARHLNFSAVVGSGSRIQASGPPRH